MRVATPFETGALTTERPGTFPEGPDGLPPPHPGINTASPASETARHAPTQNSRRVGVESCGSLSNFSAGVSSIVLPRRL